MNLKRLLFLIIISFLILSCSSSKKIVKEKNISLSTLYNKSKRTNLYYKLPTGWKKINDNNEQLFELWLVSSNNKSTIVFIPIHLENSLIEANDSELLEKLQKIESEIKKVSSQYFSIIEKNEKFENNKIKFISMEYLDDGNKKRSVIFGNDKSYYECIAYFDNKYKPTDNEIDNLFKIQQHVLLSLQMEKP